MAKKKATSAKRKYAKKSVPSVVFDDNIKGFEIEINPPPATYRGGIERSLLMQQVDKTMVSLKVGQAFLIPKSSRVSVRKHLSATYPTKHIIINEIPDNKTQLRVYYLRELKSTGQ
jgi:hypothetical protein